MTTEYPLSQSRDRKRLLTFAEGGERGTRTSRLTSTRGETLLTGGGVGL